jgi:hypothetical protein
MQCFLPKINCAEKARLLRQRAEAESDYHLAIHALWLAIRSLQKPDGSALADFADSARKLVDGAQEALERLLATMDASAGAVLAAVAILRLRLSSLTW